MATYTTLQIDGCVDYYDKKGSQYIFCDSAPFAYWKEGQRIEVDIERLKYRKENMRTGLRERMV